MSLNVYVTYVEAQGPLLKIWGQRDKKSAVFVEQKLLTYMANFKQGYGVPRGSAMYSGLLCCAKYEGDGAFYRAKVLSLENVHRGEVLVHFIDYGNHETVTIDNLRLFDPQQLDVMNNVPALAEEFYLAGVIPSHGEWNDDQLSFIRKTLCYFDYQSRIVSTVGLKKLLLVFCEEKDFSETLIERGIGMSIDVSAQEVLLDGPYKNSADHESSSNIVSVPSKRQLVQPSDMGASKMLSVLILEVGSEHNVRVSYIDDGPSAFSLQLVSRDKAFHGLIGGLNNGSHHPLTGPLLPGAVCVVECPVNKLFCRAVVTGLFEHDCKVYFVDIGHTTIVPYKEIYELPQKHWLLASFAIPFSLVGLQGHSFNESEKKVFEDLVKSKVLTLRVHAPQGPPVRQYGDLFYNGQNMLLLLLQRIQNSRKICSFPLLVSPNTGDGVFVTVSHVVSVTNFFVQLQSNAEQLKEIRDRIDLYCQGDIPGVSYNHLSSGTPVCALYPSDQKWYRAKVMSVAGDRISVLYVDYGNTEILSLSSLRQIDSDLMSISAQAVACCLNGFETLEDNERQSAQLEEDTAGKVLKMRVIDHLANDMLLVDLLDFTAIPPVNVGKEILRLTPNSDAALTDDWQHVEMIHGSPPIVHHLQYEGSGKTGESEDEKRPQKNSGGWKGRMEHPESQEHKFHSEKFRTDKRFDGREQSRLGDRKPSMKHNFRDNDKTYGYKNRERETQGKKWSGVEGNKHYGERSETFPGHEERGIFSQKPTRSGTGEDRKWHSSDRRNFSHEERNNNEQKWGRNSRLRGESDNKGYGSGKQYAEKYKNDIGTRSSSEHGGKNFKKKFPSASDSSKSCYMERKSEKMRPPQSFGSSQSRKNVWSEDINLKVFHKAAIPVGTKTNVELVFAANPSNFVVQVSSNSGQLSDMMTKIAAEYESGDEPALPAAALKVGTPCIARFPEDNNWYRAVVEQVLGSNVVVTFVDYGNSDTITLADVKKASLDLLSIPIFGFQCSLLGARAQDSDWSEVEISSFMDLTDGKPLMAHFCRMIGNSVEVILRGVVDGTEEDISINEMFGAVNLNESLLTLSKEKFPEFASADDHYNELNITPGMTEKVVVTWFINPEQFFCQMKSTDSDFVDMMNCIQTSTVGRKALNHSMPIGTPVIAKFPSDNVLYRAEVKEDTGLGGCVVQFVDYGNCEVVEFFNIWAIDKTFMSIPRQAVACSLVDVLPVDSEWPNKCSDYEKFFGAEDLDCNFLGTTVDDKNWVALYQDGISVAAELVKCGLAAAVESSTDVAEETTVEVNEEPLNLELLKGQQLTAHVTYIKTIMDFHVQLEPKNARKLQEKLLTLENKEPLILEDLSSFSDLCLVTTDGSQFFRGKILESDTSGLLVEMVDLGNQCRIERGNVWSLPLPLASIPFQATKCCIGGASKASIPSDLEDHFKMEVEDQDVIMLVDQVMNGRLSVRLFDVEGQRLELLKTVDNLSTAEINPLCPCPILRTAARCWIVHVSGPYALWMQKVDDGDIVAKLLEDLYAFYEVEGCGKSPDLIDGDKLCAAKSAVDGGWYRAFIEAQTEEGISVCFVDYGNSELIPVENVKELDPSFFSPPALAFCASLPILAVDEVKSLEILKEIVSEVEFLVTLKRSASNKWLVDTGETNSLSQQLISQDLALPIEQTIVNGEIPSVPHLKSEVSVVVSHIDSPAKFWIQQECCVNYIYSIAYCLLDAGSFPSVEFIEKDVLCAAFCHDRKQWCRGLILSANESDSTIYEVYFIDNGKTEFVDDVRELPKNLFKIPPLAIKCSLKLPEGVETWPDGTTEKFCKVSGEGKAVFFMEIEMRDEPLLVSLLQGGKDIGQELLLQDTANSDSLEVFISHITSLSDFWTQDNSLSYQLDEVTNKLCKGENFDPLPEIVNNALCAALYTEDGQWYRAKILSCKEQDICVLFIDYGNSSVTTEVRSLPSELLNIPPLAKHCSLTVPEEQSEWPGTAEEEFFEIFGDGGVVFELSLLQEGNPAIVSLKLEGQNVEDVLLKKVKSVCLNEANDLVVDDQLTEKDITDVPEKTDVTQNLDQMATEHIYPLEDSALVVDTVSETCTATELNRIESCENIILINGVSSQKTDDKNNNKAEMPIEDEMIMSTCESHIPLPHSGEEESVLKRKGLEDTLNEASAESFQKEINFEANKTQGMAECSKSEKDCSTHPENISVAEMVVHETSFSEKLVKDLQVELKTPVNGSLSNSFTSEQNAETMHNLDSEQQKDCSCLVSDVHCLEVPNCTSLEK